MNYPGLNLRILITDDLRFNGQISWLLPIRLMYNVSVTIHLEREKLNHEKPPRIIF